MNLWKSIKRLSIKQLIRLTIVLLQRPLQIRPTILATKQTMKICDALYGKAHQKNGKANAFRHALWNVLICQQSLKTTKNVAISVNWAKKITDLHEKMAPNAKLETAMDLHNNEIGRILFKDVLGQNQSEIVIFIQKRAENARKLTQVKDIEDYKNELVYISE